MSDRAPDRVTVDGASIAYRDSGSGDPLLFVHGYPLSARTWRKVIPSLGSTHRCIALDLMGAGETEVDPHADLSIPAQARMLLGFLDALRIQAATVIAHDSGAVISQLLAANHPKRVGRLVIFSTEVPGHALTWAVLLGKLLRLPGSTHLFEWFLRSRRLQGLALKGAVHDRSAFDVEEFVDTHLGTLRASRERMRSSLRFAVQYDQHFVDRLPYDRLAMPKLVLWGDHDANFPIEVARKLFELLPEPKQFVPIANCGALPHEEQPAAWSGAVQSFLSHTPNDFGPDPPR